jgi:hypothetical protein
LIWRHLYAAGLGRWNARRRAAAAPGLFPLAVFNATLELTPLPPALLTASGAAEGLLLDVLDLRLPLEHFGWQFAGRLARAFLSLRCF